MKGDYVIVKIFDHADLHLLILRYHTVTEEVKVIEVDESGALMDARAFVTSSILYHVYRADTSKISHFLHWDLATLNPSGRFLLTYNSNLPSNSGEFFIHDMVFLDDESEAIVCHGQENSAMTEGTMTFYKLRTSDKAELAQVTYKTNYSGDRYSYRHKTFMFTSCAQFNNKVFTVSRKFSSSLTSSKKIRATPLLATRELLLSK